MCWGNRDGLYLFVGCACDGGGVSVVVVVFLIVVAVVVVVVALGVMRWCHWMW